MDGVPFIVTFSHLFELFENKLLSAAGMNHLGWGWGAGVEVKAKVVFLIGRFDWRVLCFVW